MYNNKFVQQKIEKHLVEYAEHCLPIHWGISDYKDEIDVFTILLPHVGPIEDRKVDARIACTALI
jgi:hypothetical protein